MAVVGTTLKENFDSRDDIGPTYAYDLSVLSENNRVRGQLSGSPLYTSFCGYDDKENDVYYSRIWLYDMNGYIFPDSGNMTIPHELSWKSATAPFVEIRSKMPVTKAFNSYTFAWKSNDISAKCDLKVRNTSLGEYWLKDIALANLNYTYKIAPMSSGKSITESKFKLRFHLDDYKNWIEDSIGSYTHTPDWNSDTLKLVYQDEDSVKISWKDLYHNEDLIFRNDVLIGSSPYRNSFVDSDYEFNTDYTYRVNSVYHYTSTDSIVSINDNSTNYLSVKTNSLNAPKAYPIACIWQPNNKALIKWIDNSRKSANMGLYNQEAG
ncbi:MAG: hypothetical protein AB7T10_04870 [bacterium]